jgi:Anti-sigma-K factor rskA, C-terminal
MTSVPEIAVARTPALADVPASGGLGPPTTTGVWSEVEVPHGRRPLPTTLVALALVAGVGAVALGAAAGIVAMTSSRPSSTSNTPAATARSAAEQQVLALLAKPSTERVPFRLSGGHLTLAVGSGGRAAILIRGLKRAAPGQPYAAWVVGSGRPVRAAQFDGTERAVFLSVPLGPRESVVVAQKRPTAIGPQVIAFRG